MHICVEIAGKLQFFLGDLFSLNYVTWYEICEISGGSK